MSSKADLMEQVALYIRLHYEDDWYLNEKIKELKVKIYENN
jgi:hypothetical protein